MKIKNGKKRKKFLRFPPEFVVVMGSVVMGSVVMGSVVMGSVVMGSVVMVLVIMVVVGFKQLPQSFGQYILTRLTKQNVFGMNWQTSIRFLQSVHIKILHSFSYC